VPTTPIDAGSTVGITGRPRRESVDRLRAEVARVAPGSFLEGAGKVAQESPFS
jgi:hypothetical protein